MNATTECPACTAENDLPDALLGVLGDRAHLRCRYCGHGWGVYVDNLDLENDDDEG